MTKGEGTRTLLLACGALANEVLWLKNANQLTHVDLQCLPAKLHHTPALIPEAVRRKIREYRAQYARVIVIYGDCGTAGALDRLLEEEGVERIAGPHCFSFLWGNDAFSEYTDDEITTFYLTDFFCRHFDKFVWETYGLNRHESMVDFVFGNYEKLLFLAQVDDPELTEKAKEIAARLNLTFERRSVGYGSLGDLMVPAD